MLLELCTLEDLLAYPGMSTVANTEYPWLMQLVRGFTQRAETYTDRWFRKESRTELVNTGPNQRVLQLRAFGHSSSTITGIYEDLTRVFAVSTLVDSSLYAFDYQTGMVSRDYSTWFVGRQVVKVVYNAGLGVNIADVPADLRMAATMQCAFWYQRRNDLGVVQRTNQGGAISLNLPSKLLEEVEEILSQYRVFAMLGGSDSRCLF